jgi:hypothetical protein
MKIIITESQYNRILKEEEEQKVLHIPSLKFFNNDPWEAWQILQEFLEKSGNPPYTIGGNLYLEDSSIEFLGYLESVGGDLYLYNTPIKSLGNLTSVGVDLDLQGTPIKSLGNLTSVGGDLDLQGTPLSKMYNKEQIRQMVNVGGKIYM